MFIFKFMGFWGFGVKTYYSVKIEACNMRVSMQEKIILDHLHK